MSSEAASAFVATRVAVLAAVAMAIAIGPGVSAQPQAGRGFAGAAQALQRAGRGFRVEQTGTAVIRGRVVSARTGRPLARAQVAARGGGRPRTTTTDLDGRFELRELSAGRWTIEASKAGFVTLRYGQRGAFESVPPLEVAPGQQIDGIELALPTGGAVSGHVYDELGDPIANVRVEALRREVARGRPRLARTGTTATTDDRGAYRLYGLAPGDYYVAARANDRLEAALDTSARYAPTYFPGTANVEFAQPIALGPGGEQANVNFGLLAVRTVTVSGVVVDSAGAPIDGGRVLLTSSFDSPVSAASPGTVGAVGPDGRFSVSDVIPGSYTLVVQSGPRRRRQDGSPPELAYLPLVVAADLSDVVVTTTRGATLTGAAVARDGELPPLSGIPLEVDTLIPSRGGDLRMNANGTFTITGLIGPVVFRPGRIPDGWMLERIEVNGVDVTDRPVEFRGTEQASVRLVLTDDVHEVSGSVLSDRKSVWGHHVVVFADDPAKWTSPSRYIRSTRADPDGRFTVRGLMPGIGYRAVAVDYLDQGEAEDPEFLEAIRRASTAFTVGGVAAPPLELRLVTR